MTVTANDRHRRHFDHRPEVGYRIRSARLAVGISQRALVADTPYTAAYVSRIENGDRTPSLAVIRILADRLGVSPAWVETGRDDVDLRLPRGSAAAVLDGLEGNNVMGLPYYDLLIALRAALRVEAPEPVRGLA